MTCQLTILGRQHSNRRASPCGTGQLRLWLLTRPFMWPHGSPCPSLLSQGCMATYGSQKKHGSWGHLLWWAASYLDLTSFVAAGGQPRLWLRQQHVVFRKLLETTCTQAPCVAAGGQAHAAEGSRGCGSVSSMLFSRIFLKLPVPKHPELLQEGKRMQQRAAEAVALSAACCFQALPDATCTQAPCVCAAGGQAHAAEGGRGCGC